MNTQEESNASKEKLTLDVKKVGTLLKEQLIIPDYQRPYKWQEQHVKQLFDDILHHHKLGKKTYRLGTLVVHHDNTSEKKLNIVDGQQRMITLTLLATCLDKPENNENYTLLDQSFTAQVSIDNIRQNKLTFDKYLKRLKNEEKKTAFKDYLLKNCELVYVELDSLGEAFQFFDSQNARGKELAPYDLLKAYHLREMTEDSEEDRISCVSAWESMVNPINDQDPSLEVIIGHYLFRIRQWGKGVSGKEFTRAQINVFKGVTLQENKYRYTDSLRALNYAVEIYNNEPARKWDQNTMNHPYFLNQTIVNGKSFFHFIRYYADLYKKLFINENSLIKHYLNIINHEDYKGRNRVGDQYIRNLFFCAVLNYYDRFGDNELIEATRICFLWSYRIRLNNYAVSKATIDNIAKEIGELFHTINHAVHPREVIGFTIEKIGEIKASNVEHISKTKEFEEYIEKS